MCSVAIRVENLSKQYRLGVIGRDTLTRDLQSKWARFRGKEDPNSVIGLMSKAQKNGSNNSFWALKDITFDVEQGQILGIIGPNGAGKSTLLKIMSRVTTPTEGIIKVKGRIASLLEVGTGFHPELTGRENVYLNGAILGMTKKEIDKKFEEIVAFAEVEKFIDTPVKRYSSGMYVRLAFAVAAHLEPEILIVDEVLAVGDAQFQKKCLGKMEDVSKEGRTVLFVSHNMAAVASLTNRCVELANGTIVKAGSSAEVIEHYLSQAVGRLNADGCYDLVNAERPLQKVNVKTAKAFFVKACCIDSKGKPRSMYQERERIAIDVYIQVRSKIDLMEIHFSVQNMLEVKVFSALSDPMDVSLKPGLHKVRLDIDPNYLRPGDYYAGLGLYAPSLQDGVKNAISFRIEPSAEGDGNTNWSYHNLGVVRFPYEWSRPTVVDAC